MADLPICSSRDKNNLDCLKIELFPEAQDFVPLDQLIGSQTPRLLQPHPLNSYRTIPGNRINSTMSLPVFESTLPNGLKIYLSPNPTSTNVHVRIYVKAGSKHEPAEYSGLAHYAEHLISFKGSKRIGTLDYQREKPLLDQIKKLYDVYSRENDPAKRQAIWEEISRLSTEASRYAIPAESRTIYANIGGIDPNGGTTHDSTFYKITLPERNISAFEKWAKTTAEIFDQPVFRLFQTELEAVYEEKNQANDNPARLLRETVYQALFSNHPYGRSVLGTVEHLKKPSLTQIEKFYQDYYGPNNLAIVVSGNIDIPQTKAMIEKYFSSLKSRPVPKEKRFSLSPIQGIQRTQPIYYPGQSEVMIGFRGASSASEDAPSLWMISQLLKNGSFGKMNQKLVAPQRVKSAGAAAHFLKEEGGFILHGAAKKNQPLEEVEKLLLESLEEIKRGEFSDEELRAVVLNYEKNMKLRFESNETRTESIGNSFIEHLPIQYELDLLKELKKLTRAEVLHAANRYLGSNYGVAYRYDQPRQDLVKLEKPKLGPVQLNENRQSRFAKEIEAIPSTPIPLQPVRQGPKGDFQIASIGAGILLYYTRNPINDLSDLSIVYNQGDTKQDKNFCSVMGELSDADVISTGGQIIKSEEVKKRLYSFATTVDYECSDYRFAIRLKGIDKTLPEALYWSEQRLWRAQFDPEHFKGSIQKLIQDRESEKKNAKSIAVALYHYAARKERSRFLNRSSQMDLLLLSAQKDYEKRREELKKQGLKVYYTGQLSIEAVKYLIGLYYPASKIKASFPSDQKPFDFFQSAPSQPIKIYFTDDKTAHQAQIRLMIPESIRQLDPKKTVMNQLINIYLSKQGSNLLFNHLREAQGLAYAISGFYGSGERIGDQDLFWVDVASQADKTYEVISSLARLLKDFPLTSENFAKNKRNLEMQIRESRPGFREVVSTYERWTKQGYSQDSRLEWLKQFSSLTLEDFKKYVHETIESKNFVVTVVGDRDRIDLAKLRGLGVVEEVPVGQLFTD